MRHGSSGRRSRNRGNGGGGHRRGGGNGGPNRAQVFDSNGPDVRIRGTAHQICEKYMTLAKDASASGDYILAESYSQHAEHYQRIINSWLEQARRDNPHEAHDGRFEPREQSAAATDEDLGLPASIVGAKKESEKTLEDA